jgi:alpha-glucosidase
VFWGGGEQFSHFKLNGQYLPLFCEEQGLGRGDQPTTTFTRMAGVSGSEHTTYFPIPVVVSSAGRSIWSPSFARQDFDLTKRGTIRFITYHDTARYVCVATQNLRSAVSAHYRAQTQNVGSLPPLPDWAYGTWLGVQGGRSRVDSIVNQALAAGNPVTAIWVQDWVGRRKTRFGSRLWWTWQADSISYPDFEAWVAGWRQRGVQVLGYVNSFLTARGPIYEQARVRGYLVTDTAGQPINIAAGGFPAYLIDLFNPAAYAWFKGVVGRELAQKGMAGWMADFAEWWPVGARCPVGLTWEQAHNYYPRLWAQLNREVLQEQGSEGQLVFFSRSGFGDSFAYSTLVWTGDQTPNWGRHDGLPSALTGILSGGMSGILLNHSDIGGYTTFLGQVRTPELLQRWAELAAFMPVFRTHEGLKPEKNWQVYSDTHTVRAFARLARFHLALKPYLQQCVAASVASGLPVVRPLALEYPDDSTTHNLTTQFLTGEDLLVAPVLTPKTTRLRVYIPPGTWIQLWDQTETTGPCWIQATAPRGKPAAWVRASSTFRDLLLKAPLAVQ